MRINYIGKQLKCLFFCLVLSISFNAVSSANEVAVWSQKNGSNLNIYYSKGNNKTVQLTTVGTHIAPSVFTNNELVWIVWLDRPYKGTNKLQYIVHDREDDSFIEAEVPTNDVDLYAPSIAGTENIIWVVWSGFDGNKENLYLTYLQDGKWLPVVRVSEDQVYDDALPIITTVDEAGVRIEWLRSKRGERANVGIYISKAALDATIESTSALEIPTPTPIVAASLLRRGNETGVDDKQLRFNDLTTGSEVYSGMMHSPGKSPSRMFR